MTFSVFELEKDSTKLQKEEAKKEKPYRVLPVETPLEVLGELLVSFH